MRRGLIIGGTFLFALGALAGASLTVMLLVDAEYREAGGVAMGTVVLSVAAASFRRGWRRLNQEREFREVASKRR